MPFQAGDRLPGERASKLGHLDVLKSPLVSSLCKSFETSVVAKPKSAANWQSLPEPLSPLSLIFGVDGSMQVIQSQSKPKKHLGFVKTALVTLDRQALALLDKDTPHPFAIRDILASSQVYHATVFPLRHVTTEGLSTYDAIRQIIFESLRDPSLDGTVLETLKWLAYEKWDGTKKSLPAFQCPRCHQNEATLPYDAEEGPCPKCGGHLFVSDMLGFHQSMSEDGAPDAIASDYMAVQESLMLFTGVRYFWESQRATLSRSLFVKDGPLSIRAQYSKLVNPIRRFLRFAHESQVDVKIVGQEKSGAFWDHLELIGDDAPDRSFFIPDDEYIRQEIQHRGSEGAKYGKDTNYGAKIFFKLDARHRFVLSIPNGDLEDPQNESLLGLQDILSTVPEMLSSKFQSALLPVQMAHQVASLSTYPSARVLAMFADAATKK